MVGGMLTYYVTVVWLPGINPLLGIACACAVVFVLGALFERMFLTPMYQGRIDRPVEYGILITFGLAFTLQYFVQAIVGSNPVKTRRYFDFPRVRLPSPEDPWLVKTSRGNLELFDTISISNPRLTAAVACVAVLGALLYFLHRTWTGKALRAVSQDREAAAIAGIDPNRMNMLAFALGAMIAALAGALLVQAFSWAAPGGQHPRDALLRDRRPRRARLAPGGVRRRHPGGPRRGGGNRVHPRSAEGGLLHPGLRNGGPHPHPAAPADGPLRTALRERRARQVLKPMRRRVPHLLGLALLAFFLAFPFVYSANDYPYVMHIMITSFFYAILASSWSMLAGYAGQFSFGHIGFMGVGAYTAALFSHYFWLSPVPTELCTEYRFGETWLVVVNPIGVTSTTLTQDCLRQAMEMWGDAVQPTRMPVWIGILLGTLMGGVFGLLIGVLVLRLRAAYLALFTLGFAEDPQGDDQRRDRDHPRAGGDGAAGPLRVRRHPVRPHIRQDGQAPALLR